MLPLRDGFEQLIDLRVFKRNHRQQRTEELVLYDLFVCAHRSDHGRFEAQSLNIAFSAIDNAVLIGGCDLSTFFERGFRNQMRIFFIVKRVPDLFPECVLEFADKLVCDLFCDRDLIDIDADLAAVAELEESDFARGVFQVGVLSDDAPVGVYKKSSLRPKISKTVGECNPQLQFE